MVERTYICSDGHRLVYNLWLPSKGTEPKAFLQILHGMAEHSRRYNAFASYLAQNGFVVFCADMRGHGQSALEGELGWIAGNDGWSRLEDDAFELASSVLGEFADGQEIFLLGHSMGSSLARSLVATHPNLYAGAVFMGVSCSQGIAGKFGKAICRKEIRKNGQKAPSEMMNRLSFGSFNKPFEPSETPFDWLSRDASEVFKYVQDEKCGFVCSAGMYLDLLEGIERANSKALGACIPKYFSILVISGDKDPVGKMGEGVRKVYAMYNGLGLEDVTLRLIPGARHEVLNETNRQEVYEMLLSWLEARI